MDATDSRHCANASAAGGEGVTLGQALIGETAARQTNRDKGDFKSWFITLNAEACWERARLHNREHRRNLSVPLTNPGFPPESKILTKLHNLQTALCPRHRPPAQFLKD